MQRVVSQYIRFIPVIFLLHYFLPSSVLAEGINLSARLEYSNSDSKTRNKASGETTGTAFSATHQVYNLNLSRNIYPNLTFSGGTVYELQRSSSDAGVGEIETKDKLVRPYVRLNLSTPFEWAGIEYRRTELENKGTNIQTTKAIRDRYNTVLGIRPVGLPELGLRYDHIHIHDNPLTVDTVSKVFSFNAKYALWRDLQLGYDYTRNDVEDNIRSIETSQQEHRGRVTYARDFLEKRLFLNTSYRFTYDVFESPGTDFLETQITPSTGLSGLSNTPANGPALAVNSALIDGNLTASSGIDIGLAGDETTFTEMGLDFGLEVGVNRIHLWVDRRLSTTVANSFSWNIYTSPDNTDTSTWTLIATIFPGQFGVFDNRFELSFTAVETRFIKIVTRALSPTVPDSTNFPNIFVTEMQAFTAPTATPTERKATNLDNNLSFGLKGYITPKTTLGYNFFYRLRNQTPIDDKRTELNQNIDLHHTFNDMFTTTAYLNRSDVDQRAVENVNYSYGATLRANYMRNFNQTLTYSGSLIEQNAETSSANSVFLRNRAILYTGWSAVLDMGYLWDNSFVGSSTTRTTIRAETDIVPNDMITINMYYVQTRTMISDGENRKTSNSNAGLSIFFAPFRTMTLYGKFNMVDTDGKKTTTQDYSFNWLPFPDGAIQFFFNYRELLTPEHDEELRTISPGMSWSLGRHVLFDLKYNITRRDSPTVTIDSNNLNANLKLIY